MEGKLNYQKAARIAGVLFILNLLIPLLNWGLVLSQFNVENNSLETAKNIVENQSLFRFGISVELFMAIGLALLAVTLYNILHNVNKNIAIFALSIKIVEATLMAVTVLIPFVLLQFFNGTGDALSHSQEQFLQPLGVIFNSHTALTSIPMVFLGLDMVLFSYLFYRSKYIPKWIAGFGIISFVLIFIHAIMFIVAPAFAVIPINQIIFWAPSGIFEIIIGIWLIVKGLNVQTS